MMKKINEFRSLQKKKGKKGFSMIELIIVIAIMAILVALIGTQLIPYLEKSREKRDASTLDTIMTAYESVVAEHEIATPDGVISNLDTDATADFEKYAGLKTDAEPFKSEKAGKKSAVSTVKIDIKDNVITGATVGDLSVDRNDGVTTK